MTVLMKNLNESNTRIIIGNPGCGKTTTLIKELEKVAKTTPLHRIAYCSFSVAAIEEAIMRALSSLNLSKDTSTIGKDTQVSRKDLPYFRTLHSMAFHLLGLNQDALMDLRQLKEFGKLVNLPISGCGLEKRAGQKTLQYSGDKILQILNVAKLNNQTVREYVTRTLAHNGESLPKNFTINQLEDIDRRYQDYKILEEIYDYTDMLVMAKYAELDLPDLDYLFVDEAQDLSALQWILVDRLAERTDKIVIAGDDKQCQPPGSKVLTTEGFKNIEDLDEETDKLISYDKRGAQCYGKYSFKKKAHEYTGLLYTLETEKGKTTVTEGHINLVKCNRHGATIFECSTRNLIEGLMSLPHRVTNKKIEWKQIQSITVKEYSGVVYGLDVEKHHTYITDANIITHNCINEFAGADVDTFLALPGKVETLKQSYRIPSAVFNLANTIMKRMFKYRKEGANWIPREEKGKVTTCTSLPLSNILSGEWLLLARSSYQLEPMRERLIRLCSDFPFLFTINGAPPVDMDIFRVIELHKLCTLKKRSILELVTVADTDNLADKKTKFDYIKLFKKFMSSDPALKPWEIDSNFKEKLLLPWYKAMDKLDRYTIKYVEHLYNVYKEKKEDLFEDAKIRLMTIHAAKGREADNVLVCMDLPRSARASMLQADDDTEAKVLYVAITRAKKNLYLYSTNNNRYGSLKTYLE